MPPLHSVGWSGSTKKPMLSIFTPYRSTGTMRSLPSMCSLYGLACSICRILGTLGPEMSQSSSPTLNPSLTRATARLVATVLLPTPPFPLLTAMMFFTPGRRSGRSGLGACRLLVAISTSTSFDT